MQIDFTSKEESNKRKEAAFLQKTPAERFFDFIQLMQAFSGMPHRQKEINTKNFVIIPPSRK